MLLQAMSEDMKSGGPLALLFKYMEKSAITEHTEHYCI